jgi:ABC-type glycerol-3-phosphate transport system substrate-binding protein
MLPRKGLLLATFVLLLLPLASLAAQEQPTISIAMPSFLKNNFDESIFDDFEAVNGVEVYVNYVDSNGFISGDDINDYLDTIAEYAASADVLTVSQEELSLYATRAGYFLDISPLTSADGSLNAEDFFPAAWNSVQWDNGVWALPISLDATMLIYDPAAFDEAGLTYPDASWTLSDLLNAARELTQYDANGEVTTAGFSSFGSTAALLRSLYGQNFYDESGNPRFADPTLEALLTEWADFEAETNSSSGVTVATSETPMRMMGSFGLGFAMPNQPKPAAVPLPGGSAALTLNALAISSGTQQPELAYALIKYLSSNPEYASSPFNGFPARQSLAAAQAAQSASQTSDDGGEFSVAGGGGMMIGGGSSPEAQAALMQMLPTALTTVDQGYSTYIRTALESMAQDDVDANTALLEAEQQAAADLQTATDRRATVSIAVATPPPPLVLQPGEVELKFGIQSFAQPFPNLEEWQQLAADFAASDPDVGAVTLDTDFGDVETFSERDDCFYLTSNVVPSLDSTKVINLDPFLDADPSFDPNDVVGGLMPQLQKDSRTWAYPLTIQPMAMSYNANIFQQAGVPTPDNGWTQQQFVDALHQLQGYLGKTPFVPRDLNGESLMMLIASYGGLPIDYRTTPPTFNYTDPATVDAIQQVLDLAKDGYMDYEELASTAGGFRMISISAEAEPDAITTDSLGGLRRFIEEEREGDNPERLVSYPTGTYTGASYNIGTGYISATSLNPDPCYRWLNYLAEHVDVFGAMPARVSKINDPAFQASAGANSSFYQSYAQLLSDPNTLVFPAASGISSISDFITQYWLNRAFDNYVLHDGDLATDLADAQTYATSFQECIAQLPPEEVSGAGGGRRFGIPEGISNCAAMVDPTVASFFAPPE